MSLTDNVVPFHVRIMPGQDTKDRDTLLEDKKVEISENSRYDLEVGSVSKRPQMAYYNTTSLGANPTHSLYRYYTNSTQYLLAGYQGTVKVGTDAAGTFANISSGHTTDKPYSFVVYKDLCIYSNGYDNPMQTDGTVGWELGACKAALLAGGSNLDSGAAYYYAVTIDGDDYVCGAVSNTVTTTAGSRKVTLSNIPLGPSGTGDRKIYRTEGGGSTLYLIDTISNNTATTYVDDVADTTADAYPTVTDDIPLGKYLQLYRERLMLGGGDTYPSRVYYSNPFLPHYISTDSYGEISPNDGDVITGIPIMLGTMCIFKRNTIRKWHIDQASADNWLVDDPVSFQGCPADRSIVQTPFGIFYQGWDHIYKFDGMNSTPVIPEFNMKEYLQRGTLHQSVGFWHDNTYLLSYVSTEGGADYQDRVLRYDYLRKAMSTDLIYVQSFTAFKGDAESGDLYYGDSRKGFVYLAENYDQNVRLSTKTQLNANESYPASVFSGLDDIYLGGTEESPTIEVGWTIKIDDAVGIINTGYATSVIDREDTGGTYTSEHFKINAAALGKIYWHERLGGGGTLSLYTRTGATVAAVDVASWSAALSNPNGSSIASAADVYIQFKIDLTASAITESTPKLVELDGYVIRFTYTEGGTMVTDDIPYEVGTGWRNLGFPHADKIYKKVVLVHDGDTGNVNLDWETDDGQSGTFEIDLSTYPRRWESFFPSTAYGREVKFNVRKSDTNDYTLKEILGLWTPRPALI